jgi:hypothetical protein
VIHSQAGRLSATSASSQPVPATDQSTAPVASSRRSQPTSATAATAAAMASAASGPLSWLPRARGSSQAAVPSRASQTSTGTAGCRKSCR